MKGWVVCETGIL